jgi:hypothetical protein
LRNTFSKKKKNCTKLPHTKRTFDKHIYKKKKNCSQLPLSKRSHMKISKVNGISEVAFINLFAKQHKAERPLKGVALKNGVMV